MSGVRYVRDPGVVTREIGGETFLVPVRDRLADLGELHMLNETGAWVWARLDGAHDAADLAASLAEEFDVGRDAALQDVERLFQTLLAARLIGPQEQRP